MSDKQKQFCTTQSHNIYFTVAKSIAIL